MVDAKQEKASEISLDTSGTSAEVQRQALGRDFLVGWETVSDQLTQGRGNGHKIVLIVDDYTDYCLWDRVLFNTVPQLGLRPDFRNENGQPAVPRKEWKDLPVGDFSLYNLMHTMASDTLYSNAGITKPSFKQLPAIYVLEVGKDEGSYLLNAHEEKATEFLRTALAVTAKQ